jgi:hypothetical protein
VFPAGTFSSNKLCPIDVQRRYMVKGEPNLEDTFACVAQVGVSGHGRLGQALTAAMQKGINDPGGCNPGFLRKDALLMVTLISNIGDRGGAGWIPRVRRRSGPRRCWTPSRASPSRLSCSTSDGTIPECDKQDGLCTLAKMFPYHHLGYVLGR